MIKEKRRTVHGGKGAGDETHDRLVAQPSRGRSPLPFLLLLQTPAPPPRLLFPFLFLFFFLISSFSFSFSIFIASVVVVDVPPLDGEIFFRHHDSVSFVFFSLLLHHFLQHLLFLFLVQKM